jgi:DNA polymerase-4
VLGQDVTRSLRRQGLATRTVRLKLRYAGFETHTFQATLEQPTDADQDFLATAERLLREALPHPRPVRLCGIGAAGLSDTAQADLFDSGQSRGRALDLTLDALRERFGARALVRGPALAGDRPARQLDFSRDDIDAVIDGDA